MKKIIFTLLTILFPLCLQAATCVDSTTGSANQTVTNVDTSCTSSENQKTIKADATAGSLIITLESCSGTRRNIEHFFQVLISGGNTVTINPNGSETINGGATAVLTSSRNVLVITCDGAGDWLAKAGTFTSIGLGSVSYTSITACSDDEMLVSNGSAWQCKALPSGCTAGTFYDVSTNTFSCGSTGAYSVFGNNTNSTATPAAFNMTSVNAQSGAGYTITTGDFNKLVSVSNASAQDLTLPATVPTSGWRVFIANTGAGTWTLKRNGHNIDGGTTEPTIGTNSGMTVWSDGSNYFTMRGGGAGGLVVGTSTITSGTNTYILFDNSGVLGETQKVPLANGGTNADLSATGGTSQVLKQTSAGGAVTVGQLQCSDLSDAAAGCSTGSAPPTFVGFSATYSGTQSFGASSTTPTLLDTEQYDTNNFHFTSSANLTGTVSKTATSANITGSSTSFTTELTVNQVISIPGTAAEICVVKTITDNTHIVCWQTMANTASGQTAARRNDIFAIPINYHGYYMACGGVSFAFVSTTDDTRRFWGLKINGSNVNTIATTPPIKQTGNNTNVGRCYQIKVSDGDYVEPIAQQSTLGSVNGTAITLTLGLMGQ